MPRSGRRPHPRRDHVAGHRGSSRRHSLERLLRRRNNVACRPSLGVSASLRPRGAVPMGDAVVRGMRNGFPLALPHQGVMSGVGPRLSSCRLPRPPATITSWPSPYRVAIAAPLAGRDTRTIPVSVDSPPRPLQEAVRRGRRVRNSTYYEINIRLNEPTMVRLLLSVPPPPRGICVPMQLSRAGATIACVT